MIERDVATGLGSPLVPNAAVYAGSSRSKGRPRSLSDLGAARDLKHGVRPTAAPKGGSKVIVLGGTGTIGSRLAGLLRSSDVDVVIASPSRGVDAFKGTGLAEAFAGADTIVDVSSPPKHDEDDALEYFGTAGMNVVRAARSAGIRHHVVLSMVGTDRLEKEGVFRAKMVQERIVEWARRPFTIVRSTPFFESLDAIVAFDADGAAVRMAPALTDPIAADDVAIMLMGAVGSKPRNSVVEIAGPERFRLSDLARALLTANEDPREVLEEADARYFGATLDEGSLLPGGKAAVGAIRLEDWLRTYVAEALPPSN